MLPEVLRAFQKLQDSCQLQVALALPSDTLNRKIDPSNKMEQVNIGRSNTLIGETLSHLKLSLRRFDKTVGIVVEDNHFVDAEHGHGTSNLKFKCWSLCWQVETFDLEIASLINLKYSRT